MISAKLGQDVKLIGTIAKDCIGDFLIEELSKFDIDVSFVTRTKAGMNNILMALNNGNLLGYGVLEVPGVRYDGLGDIEFDKIHPGKGDFVHTSGGCIPEDADGTDALVNFINRSKLSGACISFDLNLRVNEFGSSKKRMTALLEIAKTADIIFGAKNEFELLTGINDFRKAAEFFESSNKIVICRNESDDIYYLDGDHKGIVPVEPVNVINPNGAGDTFDSAFIFSLEKGYPVKKSVEFSSYVAGYMISSTVPRDIPSEEKCIEFLNN
jgi:sugar/nucleoside kinase (ribokinase family)